MTTLGKTFKTHEKLDAEIDQGEKTGQKLTSMTKRKYREIVIFIPSELMLRNILFYYFIVGRTNLNYYAKNWQLLESVLLKKKRTIV